MSQTLLINGRLYNVDADEDTPLLWAIRDIVGLKGTKFGCGMGLCGSCTVHVDGEATRSCVTPIAALTGGKKQITTIEGLSDDGSHPVQLAWKENQVPQCGYCQAGQIMNAAALLKKKKNPSDADIDALQAGNICRCGTYQRIRAAIHRASDIMEEVS